MKALNFDEAIFNYSWEVNSSIELYDKKYDIIVSADAYYADESITEKQREAYNDFLLNENSIIAKIESELSNTRECFVPKVIKIQKNGDLAILFDDMENEEDGIAVCITPKFEILSIDQYL